MLQISNKMFNIQYSLGNWVYLTTHPKRNVLQHFCNMHLNWLTPEHAYMLSHAGGVGDSKLFVNPFLMYLLYLYL